MLAVKWVLVCIIMFAIVFRYGYVDFATNEEAVEAIDQKVEISGQSLNIKLAESQLQRKSMSM